jgi:DNA-binding Xre family transcriptional regulator
MSANFNKLFKLMIDRKIKKGELARRAGISGTTLAKLSNNESVTSTVLVKICHVLECDIGDIMEVEPKE